MLFLKTQQQDIGNSREARLYQGQALRVCAVRPALTEPNLPAPPEGGKGDGAAGAPHLHLRRGSGSGAKYQRSTHRFCGRGEVIDVREAEPELSHEAAAVFVVVFSDFSQVRMSSLPTVYWERKSNKTE